MESRSNDLKEYLNEELVLRCQKNPSYSLRSFAKSLDVSPSFLSKLLNGKRRITPSIFEKLTLNLGLSQCEVLKLTSTGETENNKQTQFCLNNLALEQFKIISDWYHYALLELTKVEGFVSEPGWIANKLGISVNQTKAAIERLCKLELLMKVKGAYKLTSEGNTTLKNDFTEIAFKKMQEELLNKAIHSLWGDPIEKRDQTSICMAINPEDIPEVKRRLTAFRRELCSYLEREQCSRPSQVYNLSLSFFALSKEST